MKLAEALVQRADCRRSLNDLEERIKNNALCQEGEEPSEDPRELQKEYLSVCERMEALVIAINKANIEAKLSNGMTLNVALAKRESLRQLQKMYSKLGASANPISDRYSYSEIKLVSTVSVSKVQKKADEYAKECREIDILIQETNWKFEIDL